MKKFNLQLDHETYSEFYRLWPDYGRRTQLLRRCIKGMIKRAREVGDVLPSDIENITSEAAKEVKPSD
jgi:hypothetical protein